ncbi:MAG: DUF222 domain-containing protein [Microbacteriaceae bacterium]|nr:DUF222 domain-containing protein [Microbacteriaceae bacterium]
MSDCEHDFVYDQAIGVFERLQVERAKLDAQEASVLGMLVGLCTHDSRDEASDGLDRRLASIALELGLAGRMSDRTVRRRLDDAYVLTSKFGATSRALGEGAISGAHATAITDCGLEVPDEHRAEYEERMLERAATSTPAKLRAFGRRIAAEYDPAAVAERQAEAARARSVAVRDLHDGMSELVLTLPSAQARAIHDRLTQLARADLESRTDAFGAVRGAGAAAGTQDAAGVGAAPAVGAGTGDGDVADDDCGRPRDDRRFDAVRADAAVELLLAGRLPDDSRHAAIDSMQGRVAITVPALTLLGADDAPAMLDGVVPVPIETARELVDGASVWLRVLTDPITGEALAADTYRPPAALRRFVEARDGGCRMPGCHRPARYCDIDHSHDHAKGGGTSACNLACLCRYHHTIKHSGWGLQQLARGRLLWTAPNGRTHLDLPIPMARPRAPDDRSASPESDATLVAAAPPF